VPQVKIFSWDDGTHVAFDANSLCLAEVDAELAKAMQGDKYGLEFRGMFYSALAPKFKPPGLGPVRKIVLNLTHACNLACPYCFDAKHAENEIMSMETADAALRMFDERMPLDVAFFGGEPLLAWPRLVEIAERAHQLARLRGVKCKLHVTTNGTVIDELKAAGLKRLGISVLLSLDGLEEIHNESRPAKVGNSFEAVMRGLAALNEAGIRPMVRATFVEADARLVERLEFFQGLYERGRISGVSIEPAVLAEGCGAMPSNKVDAEKLRMEWHEAAAWYAGGYQGRAGPPPVPLFYFRKVMQRIMRYQWMGNECGAGRGYLTVGPHGDIYACHREEGTWIGSIEGGINELRRRPWAENCLDTHEDCRRCWARYLCGGGCPQARIAVGGSLAASMPTVCAAKRVMIAEVFWLMAHLDAKDIKMVIGRG